MPADTFFEYRGWRVYLWYDNGWWAQATKGTAGHGLVSIRVSEKPGARATEAQIKAVLDAWEEGSGTP